MNKLLSVIVAAMFAGLALPPSQRRTLARR